MWIEELTAEQKAALPTFRGDWFRWGTSTDRADRAKAEAAILAMRAEVGVTKKPIFAWCASPATSLLALHVIQSPEWAPFLKNIRDHLAGDPQLRSSLGSSLRSSLGSSLRSSLGSSLRSSLESSLRSSLGSSLWSSLRSSLGSSLRSSLWSSLESSLRSSLGSSLGSSLRSSLESSLRSSLESSLRSSLGSSLGQAWWGQHESYWIAFYAFCRDVVGVKYDDQRSRQLDMWRDIARSCCWWWCYENYVVLSERPTVCRMTEQEGRPHCEDGPALAFGDGYALYRWHGVDVPEDVVLHPEQLTVDRIDGETNAEVRRVMLERYGEGRYLQDSGAKAVHRDKYGVLYRKEIPGDEPIVMVRVTNATPEGRWADVGVGMISNPAYEQLKIYVEDPDMGDKERTAVLDQMKLLPKLIRGMRRRFVPELDPSGHPVRKTYYLRVPPSMRTAHAAVAWTFGLKARDYHPDIET